MKKQDVKIGMRVTCYLWEGEIGGVVQQEYDNTLGRPFKPLPGLKYFWVVLDNQVRTPLSAGSMELEVQTDES